MGRILHELASLVGGQIEGDQSLMIEGLAGLEEAQPGQLSFYGNAKYKKALAATKASAVLVSPDAGPASGHTWVRVKNPHLAFARIAQSFFPPRQHAPGVSPKAEVHPTAQIDPTATVMAFATVEEGARIGPRTVVFGGCFIARGAQVGADTLLYSNVTVAERCVVGDRCIVHASAVVGSDGFGFAFDLETPEHVKIPQTGIVRVEDDVELGACTTIDRATLGETVVGRGTKVDNLVQIAHNVTVGPYSILCAQAGISGSSHLGVGVVLAGQVGVVGHVKLGDRVVIGAQSGVMNDVEGGKNMLGTPAIDHVRRLKEAAAQGKAPEMVKELRELRKRIEALEGAKKP
jgi:UDP-3-O-[3-hydroxymyristoyl] glucosamine N-acyltransferase